jgi:transketolase
VAHLKEQELTWTDLDQRAVDTVRVLAADAVEKVGNGHPGTAMSLAPAAYLLFQKVMRNDPSDTDWLGRDRFILSVGHSSLTQYVQLYLGGYGLELDDLKALRTWGSQDARSPGVRPHRRRRDHHRPARPGHLASPVGFAYAPAFRARALRPRRPQRAPARSTTSSTSSPATATCRRASPARPPRSPATSSSAT